MLVMASGNSNAQFIVYPSNVIENGVATLDSFTAISSVHNITNNNLLVRWTKNIDSTTTGWEVKICDGLDSCWGDTLNSKLVSIIAHDSIPLWARFIHNNIAGEGHIRLTIYDPGDSANTELTIDYYLFLVPSAISESNVEWSVTAYPNPFSGSFCLDISAHNIDLQEVEIINGVGETILIDTGAGRKTNLYYDLADQPPGMYLIKLAHEKGIRTIKMIKY